MFITQSQSSLCAYCLGFARCAIASRAKSLFFFKYFITRQRYPEYWNGELKFPLIPHKSSQVDILNHVFSVELTQ